MKDHQKTEADGSITYLWFISLVAASGGVLFGYDAVVVSGIIPQITHQFSFSSFQLGLFVSSFLWGCAIGAGLGGVVADTFGRKRLLLISSSIILLSAVWCALSGSASHFIWARLLGGVGCGVATIVCPLYISEVSPEKYRGRMVTLYHFMVSFGIVMSVFVNWGIFVFADKHAGSETLSEFWTWFSVVENWRAMFAAEALPGFLFLITIFFIPESPRWLVKNDRIKEAKAVLFKLNSKDKALQICNEIRETISLNDRIKFMDLFQSKLRKPLILSILICIFSEACGISVVLYYGPQLFEQAGLSLGSSLGGFSIIAIVILIFNLVAIRFIDKAGRRKLLAIGATGAMLSLVAIGSLYFAEHTGLIIVLAVTLFVSFFASSIGPVKFVILSEIFPNRIRGKAISVGTVCIWLTSAAVAQLFPMMREVMHTGYIFLLFALDLAALLMVVKFLMPETMGLTIEEIEHSWVAE